MGRRLNSKVNFVPRYIFVYVAWQIKLPQGVFTQPEPIADVSIRVSNASLFYCIKRSRGNGALGKHSFPHNILLFSESKPSMISCIVIIKHRAKLCLIAILVLALSLL